jgi:3-mercaptopyruvate sulfurtransferase SseA
MIDKNRAIMKTTVQEISTAELTRHTDSTNTVIVDVRPIEAYNGWKLKGEKRGGHIPCAKSLPLAWTQFMDWVEVLYEKNITKDKTIIIYGYDKEDSHQMACRLLDMDFENVSVYNHFLDEWSSNRQKPLDYLQKYQHLVYPEWVNQLINDLNPTTYNSNGYVICHSHYDIYEDYQKGHIPGAIPLNTLLLEEPDTWNRRTPEELKQNLQNLGIRYDTTVIVYGRFSYPKFNDPFPGKSAGHLGAFRCAALLLYAGVEDVRILNGGLNTWENNGYPISTKEVKPQAVHDFGVNIPSHPEYIVDMEKANELLISDKGDLVSVRSWEEFIGNVSGYHYISKKGRIPGAVFGNCGSDAYHMENYRNFDYTVREYPEVADKWAGNGINPDKHIAFYCGTGWRGSEAFLNAWLMGWPKVSVYDGGWYEWSSNPKNPIGRGLPEK